MNFKSNFYIIFVNVLIFNFVVSILNGVILPENIIYAFLCYLFIGLLMMLNVPLLRFLMIKINFLTQTILVALLTAGAMYLLDLLVPGFDINGYVVSSKQFEFIVVQSTTLTFWWTIGLFSVVNGMLTAFFESFKGE